MKLKFIVYSPDDKKIVNAIIDAASEAGAGWFGDYSRVAFVTHGEGSWKPEAGADPVDGKVGEVTRKKTAKIEMPVPSEKASAVAKAIRSVHPWEQVDTEFIRVEEY